MDCLKDGSTCDLNLRDVTGDGRPEVLASTPSRPFVDVYAEQNGHWALIGSYPIGCGRAAADLWSQPLQPVPPAAHDLMVNGALLPFQRSVVCPPQSSGAPAGRHKGP